MISIDDKPLLLLDFDNVLNMPLHKPLKPSSDYKWRRKSGWDFDKWYSTSFNDSLDGSGREFIITVNTDMIETLFSLHGELCEIAWLSTWTHHQGINGPLVSPHVAKTDTTSEYSDSPELFMKKYDFLSEIVGHQLRVAGGVGDHHPRYIRGGSLTGDWWKIAAVNQIRSQGRPVVFIDDMFSVYRNLHKSEEKADDLLKIIRVEETAAMRRGDFLDAKGFLKTLANK